MKVKVLTEAQAIKLHINFAGIVEIQPFPLKNGMWYISMGSLQELKDKIIDIVKNRPNLKEKAITFWNAIKDLPTRDTNDFPELFYKTDTTSDEGLEHAAKLQLLNIENVN